MRLKTIIPASRGILYIIIPVLTLVIGSLAILDYLRVRSITYQLASEKALVLIRQVESAAGRASISEESVRIAVTDQLFSVANVIRRWIIENGYQNLDLNVLAYDADVSIIDVFDQNFKWLDGNSDPGQNISDFSSEQYIADEDEWIIGFFSEQNTDIDYYGVAVKTEIGEIIRVGIKANEFLAIRMDVGLSALLLDLTENPEVSYALLDSEKGLIAATPDLPDWLEESSSPVRNRALKVQGFDAEFVDSPNGPVFEARTPFNPGTGVILRLGIFSKSIQQIRTNSVIAIASRTILFLLLAIVLVAFLISRQNIIMLETERKKILKEIQTLEAERSMRERLAAMGSLAGGVAHEIRNPLNTIGMATQRLEHELDPVEHREMYTQIVQSMRQEAKRIERIIADFLNFARPPRADKKFQSLPEVLKQVVDTFKHLTDSREVKFEFEADGILKFNFDADLIRQAVLNLLKNSLDSVNEHTGCIRLKLLENKRFVIIEVIDNGSGIPESEKNKIFDLYYTTKASGTGVGLPMVHRIAVEHNGRVEIDSTPGKGTTFRLFLNREDNE